MYTLTNMCSWVPSLCNVILHDNVFCKPIETRGRWTEHSGATRAECPAGVGETENVSVHNLLLLEMLGTSMSYVTLSVSCYVCTYVHVGLRRERLWMPSWFSFAAGVVPMLQSPSSALQGYQREKCESSSQLALTHTHTHTRARACAHIHTYTHTLLQRIPPLVLAFQWLCLCIL